MVQIYPLGIGYHSFLISFAIVGLASAAVQVIPPLDIPEDEAWMNGYQELEQIGFVARALLIFVAQCVIAATLFGLKSFR